MVLVKAVWSTLTAFSHGELPAVWANAGVASSTRPNISGAPQRAARLRLNFMLKRLLIYQERWEWPDLTGGPQ